ncbi:MAG: hypothetical protein ACFB2Z_09825 [Maricaulaceae bacterium]
MIFSMARAATCAGALIALGCCVTVSFAPDPETAALAPQAQTALREASQALWNDHLERGWIEADGQRKALTRMARILMGGWSQVTGEDEPKPSPSDRYHEALLVRADASETTPDALLATDLRDANVLANAVLTAGSDWRAGPVEDTPEALGADLQAVEKAVSAARRADAILKTAVKAVGSDPAPPALTEGLLEHGEDLAALSALADAIAERRLAAQTRATKAQAQDPTPLVPNADEPIG